MTQAKNTPKPLVLTFNTAQEQAQYYFNREFNAVDLDTLQRAQPHGEPLYVVKPSISIIIDEWFNNGYANEGELLKEYALENDVDLNEIDLDDFYTHIEQNNSDFENYLYGDFENTHYPMWGTLWNCPSFYIDSNYMDVDKLYKLGIGVVEQEGEYYLFIAGAGYDFYSAHWIPLFEELGWIEYEQTEEEA